MALSTLPFSLISARVRGLLFLASASRTRTCGLRSPSLPFLVAAVFLAAVFLAVVFLVATFLLLGATVFFVVVLAIVSLLTGNRNFGGRSKRSTARRAFYYYRLEESSTLLTKKVKFVKNHENLTDILTPEELRQLWYDVQFGKSSGITWVEIRNNDEEDGSNARQVQQRQ